MKRRGVFFRASGWYAFSYGQQGTPLYGTYGGVTIRDFPGGTPVPISCPIGKWTTQICKSKFNKLSQRSLYNQILSNCHL